MSRHSARSWAYQKARAHVLAANDVCWLCGRPGADTVDHVVPTSVEPRLALDVTNMRPAHHGCNARRGNGRPRPIGPPASRDW